VHAWLFDTADLPSPMTNSSKTDRRLLSESFFLGLLEQRFSAAEARRQLDTAIDWGRYAELFGFEDDTNELFVESVE
jgi:NitT/TauT family transport system ATP-binding protein